MNITPIGIDLAKTSFSLAGSDRHGKIVLRKTLTRNKLLSFIVQCPPCMIGLEACSGSHYWAREFEKLGHTVRIIAVKFIEPYRKGAKNDNNDAEAICEAVRRPNIWYVPVKSADQQAQLCVHRVRQGVVRDRTTWVNRLRGLLSEFGIVMPKGRYAVQSAVPAILGDLDNGLPELARQMIHDLWLCIQHANEQIPVYD
ncbi:MAG: IS110 family transposase, partial [Gammaproteobacteria bacterium]|nr:IS110 family transposase [Gammaproteobacteria bacterium]